MDDFKPELLTALLEWLGEYLNEISPPASAPTWSQLEDGKILWQLLSNIDPEYFRETLPNTDESTDRRRSVTDSWIPKWQNLKHIERAVSQYIREVCQRLPVLSKRMIPDLTTGAREGSMMLIAKLTMAVLYAGCTSPKSGPRIMGIIRKMETRSAPIATGILNLQTLDQRMADMGVDQELTAEPHLSGYKTPTRAVSGTHSTTGRDTELEQEALLFESNKDRNTLRTQVNKLKEDVEKSNTRISQLEEELVEARLHLDDRGAKGASSAEVERLRDDLTRERQYIDRLEGDHASAKDIIEKLKKRIARAEAEQEGRQEIKDQLQLVRAERDELEKKAKANENLKKKIETLSKESKSLETVRQELQEARERLQELEEVEERCAALEKVNKENSATLVNCEQSIFEEKSKRARIEHDNLLLMKELEQTKELQYKAEEARRELEDRMREFESLNDKGTLEDELALDTSVDTIELSSAKPTTEGRVSADSISLAQQVDILKARLTSMETETLKQMQENLGLRSDMMVNKDETSQRPFLEQNAKLQATTTELEELQRRLREKDLEMAELRNELNKKSDLGEDVRNEGLQAEHDSMLASQQKANQMLRDLEIANEEARSLLLRSLLEKDNLSPELLQIKREETLRQIREQIQSVVATPAEAQPKVLEVTSSEIAETVLKSQAALDMVKKVSNDQFPLDPGPRSAGVYEAATKSGSTFSGPLGSRLEISESAATLVSSPCKANGKTRTGDGSISAISASTTSTRGTAWSAKLASLMSPSASSLLATAKRVEQSIPGLELQDQKDSNDNLQGELERTKKESAEKGSAESQQEVEALRRENKLVTSAWYDMTSRLQSNTVVLQRKSEAPRSWLGKQRANLGNGSLPRR